MLTCVKELEKVFQPSERRKLRKRDLMYLLAVPAINGRLVY